MRKTAPKWMRDAAQLTNPHCHSTWGPGTDCMEDDSPDGGWSAGKTFDTWTEFHERWGDVDEFNRCVDFYFDVSASEAKPASYRLRLTLWMLHPRKGASRGVRVLSISESEVPQVRAWLALAAKDNAELFSRVLP